MAITKCEWQMKCEGTETIALGIDGTDNPVVVSSTATSAAGTLTPSSTIPGSQQWSDTVNMTDGTETLDLSALTKGGLSTAVNLNGLDIQLFKVIAAKTNTANLTITDGAANGYNIFGDASGQVTLPPGGAIMIYGHDGLDTIVTDTNDEIDFACAGDIDASYDVHIVAG